MVARFHYDKRIYRQFLENELSPNRQHEVNQHVEDCPKCQASLEAMLQDDIGWDEIPSLLNSDKKSFPKSNANDQPIDDLHRPDFLAKSERANSLGRFGRYDIVEVLGSGGMGIVLKGFDPALNRFSAIKILAPQLATSAAARQRFAREAKSAAAVVHEHVVPIQTVDEENGLPYLVMPVVDGQSLQQRVDQTGSLDLKEVLRIGMQIASGLAAAHGQGLVHRDIKPANVLLENGVERVMLTDFGLARAADDANMTQSGVLAGTPQYMSPEQARGSDVDHRSDLFSLGSVLYFMCTGRSPFRAKTTMGVLHRITSSDTSPVRRVNADVPEWLEGIINRLLAKDRSERYQTAEEVADVLSNWLAYVQKPDLVPRPALPTTVAVQRLSGGSNGRVRTWYTVMGGFFLVFAGVLITLEMNKGTVTIECAEDGVPVRIMKGDKVYKRLTVDRGATSTRISAGQYVVEIDGETNRLEVKEGSIVLSRRGAALAKIVESKEGEIGQLERRILHDWIKDPSSNRGPMQIEFPKGSDTAVLRGSRKDVDRPASNIDSRDGTETSTNKHDKQAGNDAEQRLFVSYRVGNDDAQKLLPILESVFVESDVRLQVESDRVLVYGSAEQHDFVRAIIREISTNDPLSESTDRSEAVPDVATTTLRMTIRVVDSEGKPIMDATVFRNHVYLPPGSEKHKIENARFMTDRDGVVVVNLSAVPFDLRLWVNKEGYVPLHAMWATTLQADGDQIPAEFTFGLRRGTEIGGIVVDDTGRPISGVKVEVQDTTAKHSPNPDLAGIRPVRAYGLAEGDAVVTNDQGRWTLNNVPPDEVLLADWDEALATYTDFLGVPSHPRPPLVLRFTHAGYARHEWGWLQFKQDVDLKSLRAKTARIVLSPAGKKSNSRKHVANRRSRTTAAYNDLGAYWSYGETSEKEPAERQDEFIDGDWRYRLVGIVHPDDEKQNPFALLRGINLHTGKVIVERIEHGKQIAEFAITIVNSAQVNLHQSAPKRVVTLLLSEIDASESKHPSANIPETPAVR